MANLRDNYADLVLRLCAGLGLRDIVETGTAEGNSTVWAADHFANVTTIDIRDCTCAKERCASKANVKFIIGDSRDAFPPVVAALTRPTFIWLDAHHEAGKYGSPVDDCTVLEELAAINASPHRHAILIDDVKCFEPPYDPSIWPRLSSIVGLARSGGYLACRAGEGVLLLDPQDAMTLVVTGPKVSFIEAALEAYALRPTRAEPLLDLATHFREKSQHATAWLFAEKAAEIPYPTDNLFVEDWAHRLGPLQELSICGYYLGTRERDRGHDACEKLALDRTAPSWVRENTRNRNLQFYAQPLSSMLQSWQAKQIAIAPPPGFHPMNPSVARHNGHLVTTVRCVNFTVESTGRYVIPGGNAVTRNFWGPVSEDLEIGRTIEILPADDYPGPRFEPVQGLEDLRLFRRNGSWCCSGTVRDFTENGLAQIITGELCDNGGTTIVSDWRVLDIGGPPRHEKNWMPIVAGGEAAFIYSCGPTRSWDANAQTIVMDEPPIACENWRGSSQAIPFNGGWLCVVHESSPMPGPGELSYQHRFAWFDEAFLLRKHSRRFYFMHRGLEFCPGLCWHPDDKKLVLSYGTARDSEAWLATVSAEEVTSLLCS